MSSLITRTKKEQEKGNGYGFTEFLKFWLDTVKPPIAETTYESYLCKVNSIINYFDAYFPGIALKDVKVADLQRFYNDQYKAGISPNTIKHYHANIHRALAYAVRMDMVLTNESEKTERPKLEKYEANFYNEKELKRLFQVFQDDRMELVALIAAYYGLRRSEIIGLRWDAVNFEKKTITIREKAYHSHEDGKTCRQIQESAEDRIQVQDTAPDSVHC